MHFIIIVAGIAEVGVMMVCGNNSLWQTEKITGWVMENVAFFKTFHGTAKKLCKQTINHDVPRIKQPRSLYKILTAPREPFLELHPLVWLEKSL